MSLVEQTLSIYYEGKAVAERVKREGSDWLEGVTWVDAITGIDLTEDILERAAWYMQVSDYLDMYGK